MILKGKIHKYGANIDTDAIIPARYLNISDPKALAKHCMEDVDQDFLNRMGPGDVIMAGDNFGCGSSREHAPVAIKASGISCVVARSFARIFFRNGINIGLPLLECPEAVDNSQTGDSVEVDLAKGEIKNITRNMTFQAKPYPEFMMGIVNAGGLVEYTRKKLAGAK
jgi:3-isopropylmalate/(R)-2-methylmalate dehydratase small subunit